MINSDLTIKSIKIKVATTDGCCSLKRKGTWAQTLVNHRPQPGKLNAPFVGLCFLLAVGWKSLDIDKKKTSKRKHLTSGCCPWPTNVCTFPSVKLEGKSVALFWNVSIT